MAGTCSLDACDRPHLARGLCGMHYQRFVKLGTVEKPVPTVEDRFWSKVRKTESGCWLWTAGLRVGYGRFTPSTGVYVGAHRFAYELVVGPIPEGLQLDHLCRTTACVNPAHLEPVTPRENLRRSDLVTGKRSAATHCPQGHPYDRANTYIEPLGYRQCRACQRVRDAHRRRLGRKQAA